ncbi:MAG: DNA polymerase III subunit delta [Rickettsiales bacterium]|nr:DNA polymerase III subunit delta [Pseudomonadota bacterium]MDA0965718.1 DNA polymerase III subunit delta [Pseudomonadota bacterium]MDG4543820.1 DNA polymerase III subunit delta [Rickettsiales bacterium]MDG4545967.1 DNA polymerase III subunit delta [Rickettsiales bacterium]MDG4548213.1 DNA polymerase III subunit delta [Rickettsiales bacterium]
MKIQPAKIQSFIKNPDKGIDYILVYGPDAGLVSEYTKTIAKTVLDDLNDPFRVADLSFDRLKDEPSILADEISAISMIGGRRLVKVTTTSTSLPKEHADILQSVKSEALVIFSAGDLPVTSTLRKFFEKEQNAAAIACYKDDSRSIAAVINEKFAKYKIKCEPDVVPYLCGSFAGDRMIILSEVEKLITYMGEEQHIKLEDVQNSVKDSSEFSLDELCNAFASRNPRQTDLHMTKALSEDIAVIMIIRSLLRYFMRLQEARNKIDSGMNDQQAVSSLRPPVFFKQVPIFKQHLNSWRSNDISRVIKQLIELEIDCKTTGNPAELLCQRLLLVLPLAVR